MGGRNKWEGGIKGREEGINWGRNKWEGGIST